MATETNLQQTSGEIKIAGIVSRIDSQYAFREGVAGNNKEYKSLSFNVRTSPTNEVTVELFGMEKDNVYPYSSTIAAAEKKKGNPKGGKLVLPWAQRHKLPETYSLIGVRCSITPDPENEGKMKSHNLEAYDAVDFIRAKLQNGDSVFINGEPSFSTYEDKTTKEKKLKVSFNIKSITKTAPINFDAEGFEPTCSFSQQIVIDDTEMDTETGLLNVYARTIQYGGKWTPTTGLVVDAKAQPKFAKLVSSWKFGDFVNVFGLIKNEAVTEEVVVEDDGEVDAWGTKPKGFTKVVKHTISQLLITSADPESFEARKYTEDDFENSGVTQDKPSSKAAPAEAKEEKLPWE